MKRNSLVEMVEIGAIETKEENTKKSNNDQLEEKIKELNQIIFDQEKEITLLKIYGNNQDSTRDGTPKEGDSPGKFRSTHN